MTQVWVDTDFGFDDLWALLILRHYQCQIAGVSLVAGNAPLAQVCRNSLGAKQAYGFDWPLWRGEAQPLCRPAETAERILGSTGLCSRGRQLPQNAPGHIGDCAVSALIKWLRDDTKAQRDILALGPLTNIARALQQAPDLAPRISRLVWMGGSAGAGNHTPYAEFNAFADPEALDCVVAHGVMLDVVDLQFCRQHMFREDDMPNVDPLTADLLGGYLDIALSRGRDAMAIYDPLAALAIAVPDYIVFTPQTMCVATEVNDTYGATHFTPVGLSPTRLATGADRDLAHLCLAALTGGDAPDGP